jgi:hypothetical protein
MTGSAGSITMIINLVSRAIIQITFIIKPTQLIIDVARGTVCGSGRAVLTIIITR